MSNKFLSELDVVPSAGEIRNVKKKVDEFTSKIKTEISKRKIKAEIFLGGSLAKETMIKGDHYEADLFVRFKSKEDLQSGALSSIVKKICGKSLQYKEIHGSRDYFFVRLSDNLVAEIVPVLFVRKPRDADNVTDLSYSHVKYIRSEIKKKPALKREIVLCKSFCKAQGIYGAESYIQGFSGYAIECLVVHYKGFLNFLREVSKKDKLILDPMKHYKNKHELLVSVNESKIKGPIVLIDPTWKERNALAALSEESYSKLKEIAKKFLRNPKNSFFDTKIFSLDNFSRKAKKSKGEVLCFNISTKKQAGDIAGTKLKKFSNFVKEEASKRFKVLDRHFIYDGKQDAIAYFILKQTDCLKAGPPVKMKKSAKAFKKKNPRSFVKAGKIYSKLTKISAKKWFDEFLDSRKKQIREMDVSKLSRC